MCLIFVAWKTREDYPLIVLANRDEFKNRPTEQLHWWNEGILAGKDIQEGGTWLGLDKRGRLAMVTNYRDPKNIHPNAPSRGKIPVNFLLSKSSSAEFIEQEKDNWKRYNGFNALFFDRKSIFWISNFADAPQKLEAGIYGLSNALLDTPWPKLTAGKSRFEEWIKQFPENMETGFDLMGNTQTYPEVQLPNTGVGIEMERFLSSICIPGEFYGTQSTTIVAVRNDGHIIIQELTRPTRQMKTYEFTSTPFNVSDNL